jgi:hypothetical protein
MFEPSQPVGTGVTFPEVNRDEISTFSELINDVAKILTQDPDSETDDDSPSFTLLKEWLDYIVRVGSVAETTSLPLEQLFNELKDLKNLNYKDNEFYKRLDVILDSVFIDTSSNVGRSCTDEIKEKIANLKADLTKAIGQEIENVFEGFAVLFSDFKVCREYSELLRKFLIVFSENSPIDDSPYDNYRMTYGEVGALDRVLCMGRMFLVEREKTGHLFLILLKRCQNLVEELHNEIPSHLKFDGLPPIANLINLVELSLTPTREELVRHLIHLEWYEAGKFGLKYRDLVILESFLNVSFNERRLVNYLISILEAVEDRSVFVERGDKDPLTTIQWYAFYGDQKCSRDFLTILTVKVTTFLLDFGP